jgi:hypothetical protein
VSAAVASRPRRCDEKAKELAEFLESEDNAIMVLATSGNDRVLARPVSIASDGLDVYFLTWKHSRKCEQIGSNPRVALCKDRVQVEGVAEFLGDLSDPASEPRVAVLRRRLPRTVERWEHRPGMIVIRVKPTFAAVGGTIGDEVWIEYVDDEKEVAFAELWAHY